MRWRIPRGGRPAAAALGLALAGGLLIGCSRQRGQVPTAPVSGKVLWKGRPVAEAFVTFIPEQPGIWAAQGGTDKNGEFTLNTYGTVGKPDGAAIGWCRVGISKVGPPPPRPPKPPGVSDVLWEQMERPGKSLLPSKYVVPDTSGLRVQVEGKRNFFTFELEGDAPP
jgi:hypothetical protein